jgi:hypothetical protein
MGALDHSEIASCQNVRPDAGKAIGVIEIGFQGSRVLGFR